MERAKRRLPWWDRAVRAALLVPFAVGMVIHGGSKARVTYPQTEAGHAYLVDRGSYVTNDCVHIDFERRIVPDDAAPVVAETLLADGTTNTWTPWGSSIAATAATSRRRRPRRRRRT